MVIISHLSFHLTSMKMSSTSKRLLFIFRGRLQEKLQGVNAVLSARLIQTSDDLLEEHISCMHFTQFQSFSVVYSLQKSFLGLFAADESNVDNGFITLCNQPGERQPV